MLTLKIVPLSPSRDENLGLFQTAAWQLPSGKENRISLHSEGGLRLTAALTGERANAFNFQEINYFAQEKASGNQASIIQDAK